MTFDEIKSKGRPCSFLSNNVKKWCQYGTLLSLPCFLGGCHRRGRRKKKIILHLFKHESVHRQWAGGTQLWKLFAAIKNTSPGKQLERSRAWKSERQPRCNVSWFRAGHGPFSNIKAGCCVGSTLTYGLAAHTPHDAMFVAHHIRNSFKSAAALYTNTHMEGILSC